MKLKKTYSFAIISALYIALLVIIVDILSYFLYKEFGIWVLLLAIISLLLISFFIIQYRVEYFIYKRVRKIYDDISLLEREDLKRKSVTTDMETLSKSVQKFAEGKRIEIQHLTERDSFRRDFLGNMAHELKTPLFTVQGYLLTLIEGASKDKVILEKYLGRANKGVERLVAVVKDLDMIAKLETEGLKLELQPFNILELVQNVFDLFEMKAKKRNITKVGIDDYNENKFIVKVSDNGEGVKQEHISRLFERFYRVDQSRSREQGGSGLGLSIVKHIIEAHNETILVKSTFKEGSEFSFTLEKAK